MVEFCIFLYWKPCPDMEIEGEKNFDPKILKEQGEYLKKDLERIAKELSILKENGWEYSAGLYDIRCYKDISLEEAKKELKKLGIEVHPDNLRQLEDWE